MNNSMSTENEEHFQSASEDQSDVDFHSPVSQQRTEASESPSPDNLISKDSSLQYSDVVPPGVSPGTADGAPPDMDTWTQEEPAVQLEGAASADGPTTDACEPDAAGSGEAVADAVDAPDPEVCFASSEPGHDL